MGVLLSSHKNWLTPQMYSMNKISSFELLWYILVLISLIKWHNIGSFRWLNVGLHNSGTQISRMFETEITMKKLEEILQKFLWCTVIVPILQKAESKMETLIKF